MIKVKIFGSGSGYFAAAASAIKHLQRRFWLFVKRLEQFFPGLTGKMETFGKL